MVKTLKISERTHAELAEFKEKEQIRTFDGAIRILLERVEDCRSLHEYSQTAPSGGRRGRRAK